MGASRPAVERGKQTSGAQREHAAVAALLPLASCISCPPAGAAKVVWQVVCAARDSAAAVWNLAIAERRPPLLPLARSPLCPLDFSA